MTHEHVVFFSGGFGSWAAAARLRAELGPDIPITLLFTDTLIEDQDLYRFLWEATDHVGGNLVWIAEGRTPWEVFRKERMMGNTRHDPCSKILKRQLSRRWVEDNCDPAQTTLYVGISWDESHRFDRIQPRWAPFTVRAPMCEPPFELLDTDARLAMMRDAGLEPPRLYTMGFPHNNCGGFCVKAGQAHFALLLKHFPERYRKHEQAEQDFRQWIDKDVAILRDRRGGTTKPLTMAMLRHRIEGEQGIDSDDWGGCGCFSGDDP